jgi:hypothetical protein
LQDRVGAFSGHWDAADFEPVGQGDAGGELDGGVEAEHFFDEALVREGAREQAVADLWLIEQDGQAVAQEVRRGLEAGDQQEHEIADQFGFGEAAVLVVGRLDQGADHVVLGGCPALGDQVGEVLLDDGARVVRGS